MKCFDHPGIPDPDLCCKLIGSKPTFNSSDYVWEEVIDLDMEATSPTKWVLHKRSRMHTEDVIATRPAPQFDEILEVLGDSVVINQCKDGVPCICLEHNQAIATTWDIESESVVDGLLRLWESVTRNT